MSLFDPQGQRLYLTEAERSAFLEAASNAPREVRTLCLVLAYTGCRVSEALALTGKSIDGGGKAIIFETLKKRTKGIYRAVPVPNTLLDTLNLVHGLQESSRGRKAPLEKRLWPWTRKTAWQKVVSVMEAAGIPKGPHRCPKGLRHCYGVTAIGKGVPLNMVSKWMGHASLEITAIYANALGEEQHAIASKMWV